MEDYSNKNLISEESHNQEELTHTDKISGMISAPNETFTEMSYYKPRMIDWILPIIVLILVSILSNYVMMNVPDVRAKIMEKQIEMMKENFDKAVESGNIEAEAAEQQFNSIVEKMNDKDAGIGIFGSSISIVFAVFLFFFIVSFVFFVIARFIFKDKGSYSHALVAYGLPSYITAIQVIVTTLLTILTGDIISGTSLNTIVGADPLSINGFLMAKLDPFRIWYYALISIAFARLFNSANINKYYIVIFGLWIGFGILILLIAQQVPWLRGFIM
jgi:hypothetical protein